MKSRYFVWNPQGRVPSFEHSSIVNAKLEAERLARLNPGQRFIVLESVGECIKSDVTWAPHEQEQPFNESEIPF
jgi:hypothetical protein